jgi:alpha-galactosidase
VLTRHGMLLRITAVLALACACACLPAPSTTQALDNGLALTPYMGWNSIYGKTPLYEEILLSVADTIVSRGLLAAGYQYVWLDATWWDGVRDPRGNMVPPPRQWPHGLRYLTDYLHNKGLRVGIYTDAGADGCAGPDQGSGPAEPGGSDHYQQDADQFAAWGFDAVKVDFCGGYAAKLDPETQYTAFGRALRNNASARPLLYNICDAQSPWNQDPSLEQSAYWSYTYGPAVANSWRTESDIGVPGQTPELHWSDFLRNLTSDAAHPEVAGPGHWNDPDYLMPELGLTAVEDRTQVSMWAMLAAPLMIGSDVRTLSDATLAMLTNPEVIAVDQDSLGRQGSRLSDSLGLEIWSRPLVASGSEAVALLNLTSSPKEITVTWSQLGLRGAATVRDLWDHAERGVFATAYTVTVSSHGTVLLLVRPSTAQQTSSVPQTVQQPAGSATPALESGR